MTFAVFLRGANVGGARVFRPAELAKKLGAKNIGAAGTFVVEKRASKAAVKREFAKALPFETEILVRSAAEIAALVASEPFGKLPAGAKPVVAILAGKPAVLPGFPLDRPETDKWEVRVFSCDGLFAPACYRVFGRLGHYPNEIVEKFLGVAATTRGWPTILTVAAAASVR